MASLIRTILPSAGVAILLATASGARAADADDDGVEVGGSYVSDTLSDISGGVRRGTEVLGKADFTVQYRGPLFGVEGATAWLDLQYVHGRSFSGRRSGDAQTVSNIEAVSALRPFEAWLQLPFALGSAQATVTAGLIDLNGTFDVQEVGRLFMNSSHGIGYDFSQTGQNGPSIFPTTAPAFVFTADQGPWSVRFGAFEAIAGDPAHPRRTVVRAPGDGGVLFVGEVQRAIGAAEIQFGLWAYSSRFDALDPARHPRRLRGNHGGYALVESRLWGKADGRRLDGWLRVGIADRRINAVGTYFGGGLTYGDDHSRAGLAIAHARLGHRGRSALATVDEAARDAETAIELTYSRRLAPWLRIQPDAQYVLHPSWRRAVQNALVVGLRLVFEPF